MSTYSVYYATNRRHVGRDRWRPSSYGPHFSADGHHNLRFGKVTIQADGNRVAKYLVRPNGPVGEGDGEGLAHYLSGRVADHSAIAAFEERPASRDRRVPEGSEAEDLRPESGAVLGSKAAFAELRTAMLGSNDVIVYIHGFNVSWKDAVGSALALELMLNRGGPDRKGNRAQVFLFSWPSDGKAYPLVSYRSDRKDGAESGEAVARGLLKVNDFLVHLREEVAAARRRKRPVPEICRREVHLLCHSMGNYVLQNALAAMLAERRNAALPRLFSNVFLCASDVDSDVLEPARPMARLHELAEYVNVYHNRGDAALVVSDVTKGNPERLGHAGAAHPAMLHNKVHQIDCSPIVTGWIEHSYYLSGRVNQDIRLSLAGLPPDDAERPRTAVPNAAANLWRMT
jgi:esterase/lipase superfamily enzyme